MKLPPLNLVTLSRLLFLLIAGIWLIFGFIWIVRHTELGPAIGWSAWLMPALVLMNAFLLSIPAFSLRPGRTWAFYFGITILAVNILLTFTDQFGLFDFATLLIDVLLLILLIGSRRRFLHGEQSAIRNS